jgi:hypothetical protein
MSIYGKLPAVLLRLLLLENSLEVLWQLKKYYDERARYYKNMHSDILYLFDRIDNQDLEQHDFMDTTADDLTHK